jgi:hypothetical protein
MVKDVQHGFEIVQMLWKHVGGGCPQVMEKQAMYDIVVRITIDAVWRKDQVGPLQIITLGMAFAPFVMTWEPS